MGERLGALLAVVVLLFTLIPAQTVRAANDPVATGGTVTIEADDQAVITIDGMRVQGHIELLADGTVINELPFESYVAGIAEMPARWPIEALKAQAVAARTYAWWSMRNAEHGDADICATTACQVYRGVGTVEDGGGAWAQAVEQTRSQVLVDDRGAPILARYFSTSGGRTYANEDVFPSTGAHPALQPVDDPYDASSPYHRWEVRFTREEFDTIVSRGERLSAVTPVAAVSRRGGVDDHRASIVVTSEDGAEVEVSALELRDFISAVAPDSFPDRFPTRRSDGLVDLPSTLPSSRFDVQVTDEEVVFEGRGWGHGVGMGQYGARGRAQDGASYREILATYYSGLEPISSDELPGTIRVELPHARSVSIRPDAPFSVTADGAEVADHALGTWRFEHAETRWEIVAPAERDDPLRVADTRVVSGHQDPRTPLIVETTVNKPAQLSLDVSDAAGEVVFRRELGVVDPGEHAAAWTYVDESGERVAAGGYELTITARDSVAAVSGASVTTTVGGDPTDGRGAVSSTARSMLAVLGVSLAAITALVVVRKVRA